MSDNVDALLGGEDDIGEGVYDLRDEEEDALLEDELLEDDGYEQSREINSVQEDKFGQGFDESGDVLELSAEELLNEDEETDFNDAIVQDSPRDKFKGERAEVPSSSSASVPDTTTRITRKPMVVNQRGAMQTYNRGGRFQHRGVARGSFRGGVRGRGGQWGYQNVQNRNARPRPEAWVKKPMQVQPWANNRSPAPAVYHPHQAQQPLQQSPKPWASSAQEMQMQYQNPVQPMSQMNKPPVHQRLGYQQPPQQQHQQHHHHHQQQQQQIHQYPNQQFLQPPPVQIQQPQQIPFEQERIISVHPVHMGPQQNYHQPQQYSQPPPIFNQPPPNQYGNQNMYQPPPNDYQNNYIPPPAPQQQQQYNSQYNPDPYIQPQQQQPVLYQNEPSFYEPPQVHNYNGNDGYNEGYNYNTPPAYDRSPQPQYSQQRIVSTNSFEDPLSPQKRRMEYRKPYVEKEVVLNKQRKVFENKNLHEVKTVETPRNAKPAPTSTFEIAPTPIPDNEDDETRKYRLEIEKQKRLREQLLARKEERRKLAARQKEVEEAMKTIPSPMDLIKTPPNTANPIVNIAVNKHPVNRTLLNKPPVDRTLLNKPPVNHTLLNKPPVNRTVLNKPQKALTANPNLRVVNTTNALDKDQIKAFLSNRKIIAKDESLLETSIVVVSNLAAGTSEVKLRKICSGVGDIQVTCVLA